MQNRLKETKSQERLINLMLQAGVEWPEGYNFAAQDDQREVMFYKDRPKYKSGYGFWVSESSNGHFGHRVGEMVNNYHTTIITRVQYEARDGWITWHGGECPVDRHVVVDVTYRDGEVGIGLKAVSYRWHGGSSDSDIIAYRIHKQAAAEPCESVNACIPYQPTIEQRIKEWRNQGDVIAQLELAVETAQRELDDAKAEADKGRDEIENALAELGWHFCDKSRKLGVFKHAYGNEPEIISENFGLICDDCGERLGRHGGYRCP